MSTRNLTMVVNRADAQHNHLGFACKPTLLSDKSYVNMYLHHDGYPEWQGVQLANWCHTNGRQDGSSMAAKLVHDMYYDSCYLYQDHQHIDHHYTYIIWTGKPDVWITCWNQYTNSCVFVSKVPDVIKKWSQPNKFEYTDFSKNPNNQGNTN